MSHQDDLSPKGKLTGKLDVAKSNHSDSNETSELSDEQMAKITGGITGGFPDKGGSGDTSITPVPTAPGSNPTMP